MTAGRPGRLGGAGLVVMSLLVAAGCAPVRTSEDEAASSWVAGACAAIDRVGEVAERPHRVSIDDLTGPEQALPVVELLDDVGAATQGARTEVAALGSPPVDEGPEARDEILAAFDDRMSTIERSREIVVEAQGRWDSLAPSQIVGAGQSAYRTAPELGRAVERIPALREAFRDAPECEDL